MVAKSTPHAAIWRGVSLVLSPIVTLVALATFSYEANAEGLREARALFVAVPLLSVVANIVALRRSAAGVAAVFFAMLTFGLTVYGIAALTGLASAVSLLDRPTGFIALIGSAWTLAALVPWPVASED